MPIAPSSTTQVDSPLPERTGCWLHPELMCALFSSSMIMSSGPLRCSCGSRNIRRTRHIAYEAMCIKIHYVRCEMPIVVRVLTAKLLGKPHVQDTSGCSWSPTPCSQTFADVPHGMPSSMCVSFTLQHCRQKRFDKLALERRISVVSAQELERSRCQLTLPRPITATLRCRLAWLEGEVSLNRLPHRRLVVLRVVVVVVEAVAEAVAVELEQ